MQLFYSAPWGVIYFYSHQCTRNMSRHTYSTRTDKKAIKQSRKDHVCTVYYSICIQLIYKVTGSHLIKMSLLPHILSYIRWELSKPTSYYSLTEFSGFSFSLAVSVHCKKVPVPFWDVTDQTLPCRSFVSLKSPGFSHILPFPSPEFSQNPFESVCVAVRRQEFSWIVPFHSQEFFQDL